jgi:AmiR/NasT family two-component response regulator
MSATGPAPLRIVVAEDEAIIRLDLVEMLREEGYEVVGEASRGDDAIDVVRSTKPDLALFDVKMPGLDGISAARTLAEAGECGVVILTAFSQRELIAEATDAGVLGYLLKPFQKAELIASIEVCAQRQRERKALAGEVRSLEDRLAARKLIDRAKAKLMAEGADEASAFATIQRRAMDQRTSMGEVSSAILDES